MLVTDRISEALQKGKSKDVVAFIEEALNSGISTQDIIDKGLLRGMSLLGVKFENNEVFVPEVLIAARALNKGFDLLTQRFVEVGIKPIGKAITCTVKGDLHDIGKNLLRMMLECVGFEVIDMGVDVDKHRIIEAVKEHKPDVLCLSAMLTTTMGQQGAVIEALKTAGLRKKVKVMVGGTQVTKNFCESIHADAYSQDAASAAKIAKTFV